MATLEQKHLTPPLTPTPAASIQPGGHGLAVRLELAWGRLRRAFLHRFRPGYVQQMHQARQGSCPECCHDIVDARDLKFVRNVCGYHFGPANDPFRGRSLLPLARPGIAEVVIWGLPLLGLAAAGAILAFEIHPAFWLATATFLGLWIFIVSFFRDPERTIPKDADAVLSPADGTIIEVGEIDDADFPGGRALRVAIFLSPFNVHVNRIPRTGKVVKLQYLAGQFVAATRGDCDQVNEQFWLDIEEPCGRRLRIKQVAGAVARRIVCWLRPGELVQAGDRYGMIKLGSRTDLLLPVGDAAEVLVKAGDKVRGGMSLLLRLRPTR